MYSKQNQTKIEKIIKKYKLNNKSPYSLSYYNSKNIDWDYKPEGSLRLSDHWNFMSQGEKHCKLSNTDEYTQKWLLCEYHNGKYYIVDEIFTEEELALEERMRVKFEEKEKRERERRFKLSEKRNKIIEKGCELLVRFTTSVKNGRYFKNEEHEEKCFVKGCWAFTSYGKKRVFSVIW